jgi:hypothetical protein
MRRRASHARDLEKKKKKKKASPHRSEEAKQKTNSEVKDYVVTNSPEPDGCSQSRPPLLTMIDLPIHYPTSNLGLHGEIKERVNERSTHVRSVNLDANTLQAREARRWGTDSRT